MLCYTSSIEDIYKNTELLFTKMRYKFNIFAVSFKNKLIE